MITIEKDIPFIIPEPLDTSLPSDWPMDALGVGDSFLTGTIRKLDIIWYQRSWSMIIGSLLKKSFRYQQIEEDGGNATYRIWRTK